MSKAQLITIGTEITTGEIVNTNAAWVAQHLEEHGVRVFSHVSVRDQRDEILRALRAADASEWIVVTGGLGPTSDDITRACVAEYVGQALEFDSEVWQEMERFYHERGLPLREAHKQQCYFPTGSRRLKNPVGTALGFQLQFEKRHYIVLPGPPLELEGIWDLEVEPELQRLLPPSRFSWRHWTCLGVAESEVAEMVEKCIAGSKIEVGYRATIPYVKVKLYVDESDFEHQGRVASVDRALMPFVVGDGVGDLAEELLRLWPQTVLPVSDSLCEKYLVQRLFTARSNLKKRDVQVPALEFFVEPQVRPDIRE